MKLYKSEFNQKLQLHFFFFSRSQTRNPRLAYHLQQVRSERAQVYQVLQFSRKVLSEFKIIYRSIDITHSQRLASMFVTAVTRFTLVIHRRWQRPLDIVWGSFPGGVQTGDEYFHRRVPVEIQGPSQLPDLQSEQARQIRSENLQTFGQ